MIKDTDIRKGNKLLLYKPLLHEPQQLTVKGYYYNEDDGLWYIQSDEYVDINMAALMPIPLTVECIARCGFDWNPEDKVYSRQVGNTVYIEYDVDFNCSVVPETWRGHPLHLWGDNTYLHKLQNLYFDMTGEEIEIKP
jgi:hypothetical protein